VGSEGLEPTTPAVFLPHSFSGANEKFGLCSSQSGVLTKLDDEPASESESSF
jgi:hypothetical protein